MYSTLIVDDEKMIRNGIRAIIPWAKIGIGRVYVAADGAQALEIVEGKKPDILLTDIRMSEMNGLMLIEKIRKTNSDMRILVLTGYDSFDYAQRCLKLQVQDFILKPVDEDVLAEALRRQVAALEESRAEKQKVRLIHRVQSVREQARLEQAMRDLAHGKRTCGALGQLLADYDCREGLQMQLALFAPVLPLMEKGGNDDFLTLSIKNLCIDTFDSRKQGITFEDDDGRIAVAVFISSEFDEAVERVEQLGQLVEEEFGSKVQAVLGGVVGGIRELPASYDDACALMDEVEGRTDEILQSGSGKRRLKIFAEILGELRRVICSNIGDSDKIDRAFAAFEKAIESYNLSNSYVRRCCFDIAANLYFTYVAQADNSVDNRLNALLTSLQGCSRGEACALTRTFIGRLSGGDKGTTHEIVATAIRYIRGHLSEELSVSSIARQLYVNANYLSRLFKKTTGEGCNGYIVRKRVEKAKCLLETTSLKTGKIADMVGYRDANYFSLAFKKYTGVSPTAYRDSLRGREPQDRLL